MTDKAARNPLDNIDASGFEASLLFNSVNATQGLNALYRQDETESLANLLKQVRQAPEQVNRIAAQARRLVEGVREQKPHHFSFEFFLKAYGLSSPEGLAMMCLAEALLRIPDKATQTLLIRDKLGSVSWQKNLMPDGNFLARLSAWGLAAADRLSHFGLGQQGFSEIIGSLTRRLGEPVIRQVIFKAMKILARQFVMGKTIAAATRQADAGKKSLYRYSYDMLGEEACTQADADRYYQAYVNAVETLGNSGNDENIFSQPGISVKLSALHPRYQLAQRQRVCHELIPQVLKLANLARQQGIGLTIDAEESERLDLSLEILHHISAHESLKGWNGLGLAVQAYQKRAPLLIDCLADMAKAHGRRLCIRLVKGAYWDSEVKRTQERGLKGYAVYTRKAFTDVSWRVCAQKMLAAPDRIYPQFATHNAYTIATVLELAGQAGTTDFEFQRLYGMGEALYGRLMKEPGFSIPCRIYAPVGDYKELLPYLVRRLLENGANTSFVHKIHDLSVPVEDFLADPVAKAASHAGVPHPLVPLPRDLFQGSGQGKRLNSKGVDLDNSGDIQNFYRDMLACEDKMPWVSAPIVNGKERRHGSSTPVYNPFDRQVIGQVWDAQIESQIESAAEIAVAALNTAEKAFKHWSLTDVGTRADVLDRLSHILEGQLAELTGLLVKEGGKTIPDAIGEVREAVDFCRYYAGEARRLMSSPLTLSGVTGELNQLTLNGRGIFACISPWNFPLSIFLGQIVAALVSGNCVIAKPAHQTPLIAYKAIQLAYQAGIPETVLQYLPCSGSFAARQILTDPRVAGVAFTGSTAVARSIAQTLASRPNAPLVPLIAETGGMNALIVDSSALIEQVVHTIIISAFHSAGQRCSALRMLFVQEDIADGLLEKLQGAMAELSVGNPALLSTDIGPVIDLSSASHLNEYVKSLEGKARPVYWSSLKNDCTQGTFVAPQAWELTSADQMVEEIFGPILHVVRFKSSELNKVIEQVSATGYGLTLGIHSRIEATIQRIRSGVRAGNIYVNRPLVGAVVGVQPFGGEGLSGTGPKAGGPNYLTRFMVERTFSQDTTAAGGNACLLADMEP